MAQTVEVAIYRLQYEGQDTVDRASRSLDRLAASEDGVTRAQERQLQQNRATLAARREYDQAVQRGAAANDNYSDSLRLTGAEALSVANHFKTAAVAAYALSPAFRDFANPIIATTLRAMGPAAVAAGATILSALSPVLAFASRLAVPILLAVEAFKALNAITELGAERLQTVAELQEAAFKAAGNLKPERKEIISTEEVAQANELNDRMAAATKLIEERWLPLKRDLVGVGVQYNETWVQLKENIAAAVGLLQQAYDLAKGAADAVSRFINNRLAPFLPTPNEADARAAGLTIVPDRAPIDQARDALRKYLADQRLVQQQTLQTADAGKLFRKEFEEQKKTTEEAASAFDREIDRLNRHIAVVRADAETMGMSVAAREARRAQMVLEEAAGRDEIGLSDERIRKIKEEVEALREATQAREKARVAAEIKFQTQTLGLSPQDVQIAQQLRGLYPDVTEALNSSEAAQLRFLGTMREIKDLAASFISTFIQGLISGKSAMESLGRAATQLGNSLINSGITDLLSGNFITGGIKTAVGVGLSIFGQNQEKKRQQQEQQRQAMEEQSRRLSELRQRQFAATIDTTTQEGALAQFDFQAQQQRQEVLGRLGPTAQILARFGQQVPEMVQLEATLAAEREKILKDFAARAIAKEKEIAARRQNFQDQAFILVQDQSTLAGQLAVFDLQAQREREAEVEKGGDALVQLEQLQALQRQKIIKDFNDQVLAETKRAEQERLDALTHAASNIVNYINGLLSGPESTLSPQARLANAQAAYNAQFALAQAGNIDALNSITTFAENLRKAARDVFGSGTGYQSIFDQIKNQLLGLPAVATSSDPVVGALRDVLTGVQATTQAVNTNTTKVVEGNTIADAQKQLQNTANLIAGAQADLLTAIKNLQDTSSQQLQLLNSQYLGTFSGTPTNFSGTQSIGGQNLTNTIANALNKIVFNTAVIAFNTASLARGEFGEVAYLGTFATGGLVRGAGTGTSDSIMARVSNGEYIVNAAAARANMGLLDAINAGRAPANDNGWTLVGARILAMHEHLAELLTAFANANDAGQKRIVRAVQARGEANERNARMQATRDAA